VIVVTDYFVNKAGAKIYNDVSKHPVLEIPVITNGNENGRCYKVLSIGMVRTGIAMITIQIDKNAVAYRLPVELTEWAQTAIGMAMSGIKPLPTNIEFGVLRDRYYAEIL
jgi:hypothetical protein